MEIKRNEEIVIFAIALTVLLLFSGVASADYLRSDTIPDAGNWVGYKIGVHPTTHNIYAPSILSGELRVFDSTDYSPIKSIPLSNGQIVSVDFNPSQNLVYAVGEYDDHYDPTLWVINGNTHVVDRTVQLSSGRTNVWGVAFNPTANKIYVTTWWGDESILYIVDADSYGVEHLHGDGCRGVAVNPDTNKVYVAQVGYWGADRLVVVDGGSNNILTEIDLPDYSKPAGVAVNTITNKVYVFLQGTNEVAVIDGGTDTSEKVISLGAGGAGY
ncbi:MAG: YncE family protein [Methanophagales archaeon]|nr:YncE family protein [Methanophagales archaeon]